MARKQLTTEQRARETARDRARRTERRANNQCVKCGVPAVEGRAKCAKHLAAHNEENRERQRARRAEKTT